MKKIYVIIFSFSVSILSFGQQSITSMFENSEVQSSEISKSIGGLNQQESYNDDENVVAQNTNELIFINLRANTSSNSYDTDIYFNDLASTGFDVGFDASLFGAIPAFVLYTELVEDNMGLPLAIQAVNTSDLFGVSVPVVIQATQGVEITISIITSTLPDDIEIYFDDTLTNTSTLLNDSDYVFTPTTNLMGSGRFFLRTVGPSVVYTYDDSWSPNDPNGTATINDDLIIVSGDATINSDLTVNSVTVNPGAGIIIDNGTTLTTANGLNLESSSTSYSSLILNGSISGPVSYERHVNINGSGSTGSNDLISAPLTGQAFSEVASANPNILNNGTLFLFGPFDKATGSYVNWSSTETTTLQPSVGYRSGTTDNGTITFTGNPENTLITNNIINSGTNNAEWNLVGNPYPSYINVYAFLTHEVSPGVSNLSLFNTGSEAIYGYDGNALNGWTIYNLATTTPSTVIAPGQGFFVSANTTDVDDFDLEFTPAMRSTGTTDDFIAGRNAELIFVKINASADDKSFNTDVYFNINSTLGFDFGYDAEVWGNTVPDFAIYSHLVDDNQGKAIALQSLNHTDLSNVTIPLGVNANQGEQLTFSIADLSLPESVNVYLDDVVANTTTLLNSSDYSITPATNLSGTGRFFLRTSDDALSTVDNSLDQLNIFALNSSKELVVSGQLQKNARLELYDIQGRKVISTLLDSNVIENRIDASALSAGVYVVTVQNNGQHKTQKVVIN